MSEIDKEKAERFFRETLAKESLSPTDERISEIRTMNAWLDSQGLVFSFSLTSSQYSVIFGALTVALTLSDLSEQSREEIRSLIKVLSRQMKENFGQSHLSEVPGEFS